MPVKSRWEVPIPDTHLASLIFKSPTHPLSKTQRCLLEAARPDTHYFTVHDYRLWSQRFAAGLRKSGIKPGDRILFFSGNDLFYMVVFMGTIMAGAIFTGANPTYVPRELAYQLQDSGATYLLCAESSLDTGIAAAELIGMSKNRIFVFNNAVYEGKGEGKRGCRYWGELIASEEEGSRFAWDPLDTPAAADSVLALNYSSGTTGKPKGVEITHKNYVANTVQALHLSKLDPEFEEKDKRARWLAFLPMYHAMSQTLTVSAILRRIPVYVQPRFDFLKVLEYIERFRITTLIIVPPIVVALAKHPAVKKYDLSSVESISCGAAPLGREVCEEAEALWKSGEVNIKQGWGMTEVTCSFLSWHPCERSTTAAVGELLANCEAKIMADDGVTELGRNQRGELWVRGPNVMKGYWRNPQATRETKTEDGWLKTGDIAYVDDEGKFYVVDRKKELIKVKGNQVAPAELEAQLLEHPAVADAAVIGLQVNHEEYPRAYIVLKPGHTASAEAITKFINERVAPVKRLIGGVVFTDSIPKNPSGKILRRELRERAKREVAAGAAAAAKL
ncbi:hypothetical protein VTN77DRAFT_8874 [Rasamsonia byssochlamydoides]|uniref:uncharacterized protein n=1 Tax=Rasamsonia byssochlamydoides TaxID=89139 RepID=UPI0037436EC3